MSFPMLEQAQAFPDDDSSGFSKYEFVVIEAMKGLLSNPQTGRNLSDNDSYGEFIAGQAVDVANALFARLGPKEATA